MRGSDTIIPFLVLGACLAPASARAQSTPASEPASLQVIIEQNRLLQEQVKSQQKTIDTLNTQMEQLRQASERQDRELHRLAEQRPEAAPDEKPIPVEASRDHEVRIGGQAGLGYFQSGTDGQFPKGEFRVDDTTITVEAPVWKDVYFFSEVKIFQRETSTANFQFGELYVDFERLGTPFGHPDALNVRVGSVNTPFGEEYLVRGPADNALISHSLSDIWGPDEGMEVYGTVGRWSYAAAVQNGGISQIHDFHSSKAFAVRLGWDPTGWLHLSGSAMRTGKLAMGSSTSLTGDGLSSIWFANGFFRALGPASRTTNFWANLYEADAVAKWKTGKIAAAYGQVHFDDNDTLVDNSRKMTYGYVEVVQSLNDQLYGATRYSAVNAPGGYPLAGQGNMGEYFFSPKLTDELQRFSFGLGYRFGPPLVLKLEYSWEWGHTLAGESRDDENFFGAEVGLRF